MGNSCKEYCTVSVIVPTFNEEENIARCLEMIQSNVSNSIGIEIIVVDHGSRDKTVSIAESVGAKVLHCSDGTVGRLRNEGARNAINQVLIFLDADVMLTSDWKGQFTLDHCMSICEQQLLTGSWVGVSETPSFIERFWFEPLVEQENSHINSGHLIVSKKVFWKLGGFNEQLETGEDYDFSMRAQKANVLIYDDSKLRVSHEGYPKTLKAFFLREIWHGRGDFSNLKSFFSSKVALLSMLFAILHLSAILTGSAQFIPLIAFIPFACSIMKYRKAGAQVIIVNALLYYIYFCARFCSFLSVKVMSRPQKHSRSSK